MNEQCSRIGGRRLRLRAAAAGTMDGGDAYPLCRNSLTNTRNHYNKYGGIFVCRNPLSVLAPLLQWREESSAKMWR